MTSFCCRHCSSPLADPILDLGHQPPSNAYLTPEQINDVEYFLPLKLYICTNCWLVQLPLYAQAQDLFTDDYAYFSSTSITWCNHARIFVDETISRLNLDKNSRVVEIASNDGYLLQNFVRRNIPCVGIEPTLATAEAARYKGIPTMQEFFGSSLAQELDQADLVIANNVLAHVPDINDFIKGIATLLRPTGFASIEFPHLLRLIEEAQFDTIYHEHYSYLSLGIVLRIAASVGLQVCDVEELPTHGGSLRVWLCHYNFTPINANIQRILDQESEAGLKKLDSYSALQVKSEKAKYQLLKYLINSKEAGKKLLAYGAAAKGNTLLNYAGIKADLIPYVIDRAPSKQGKFLPGSHIPIVSEKILENFKPDNILVLPWNLIDEVKLQLPDYKLVTAMPHIKQW